MKKLVGNYLYLVLIIIQQIKIGIGGILMAVFKDYNASRTISVTVADLEKMYVAQAYACRVLNESGNSNWENAASKELAKYSAQILSNVFGTSNAAHIGVYLQKVREENRSLGQSIANEGSSTGLNAIGSVMSTIQNLGGTKATATVNCIRVYESGTLFTLVSSTKVTSVTLPNGNVITM